MKDSGNSSLQWMKGKEASSVAGGRKGSSEVKEVNGGEGHCGLKGIHPFLSVKPSSGF